MIKEALEYIIKNSQAQTFTIDGKEYADKTLFQVLPKRYKETQISVSTLQGLIDYALLENATDLFLHVESYHQVSLCKKRDPEFKDVIELCRAEYYPVEETQFDSSERLLVYLQTNFVPSEAMQSLVSVVGNLKTSIVRQEKDDGVTQSVEIQKGISFVTKADIPNPILLRPYSTFGEVPQVDRLFVIRAQAADNHTIVRWHLLPSSYTGWKAAQIMYIKQYIQENMPKVLNIPVIG